MTERPASPPLPPISQLHLILTEACNRRCEYCFEGQKGKSHISSSIARAAIDRLFESAQAAGHARAAITFWGGEPFLRFEPMRELVEHAEAWRERSGIRLTVGAPTNATLLTDAVLGWVEEHAFQLYLSVDGTEAAMRARRTARGASAFPLVEGSLERIARRWRGPLPPVRMTVTPENASFLPASVDHFLERGFRDLAFYNFVEGAWTDAAVDTLRAALYQVASAIGRRVRELGDAAWPFPRSIEKVLLRIRDSRSGKVIAPPGGCAPETCGAGSKMLAVDTRGRLYPCHRFVFYDRGGGACAGTLAEGLSAGGIGRALERLRADEVRVGGEGGERCVDCAVRDRCLSFCPAVNYAVSGEVRTVPSAGCRLSRALIEVSEQLYAELEGEPVFRRWLELDEPEHASLHLDERALEPLEEERLIERVEEIHGAAVASSTVVRVTGSRELRRYLGARLLLDLCGPERVQVNLVHRCNARCVFCFNHSPDVAPRLREWERMSIPTELALRAIDGARALRADEILFTGKGEPFLHPDFERLAEAVKSSGLRLVVQTNLLACRSVRWLFDVGIDQLVVNVSAAGPASWVRVHPLDERERFEELVRTLEEIRDEKRRTGRSSPEVLFTYVICSENYAEIEEAVELAGRLGVDGCYFKMVEVTDELGGVRLNARQRAVASKSVERARAAADRLGLRAVFPAFEPCGRRAAEPAEPGPPACHVGWYFTKVEIDGTVHFCCKDKPVGSLADGGLHALWHSDRYQRFRIAAASFDRSSPTGVIDAQCERCSNFAINQEVAERIRAGARARSLSRCSQP